MKVTNASKDQVNSLINLKEAGRYDFIVNLNKILPWTPSDLKEVIYTTNDVKFDFARWPLTQVLEQGKVPAQFYDRCNNALKQHIFGDFITSKNKEMLFRRTPRAENQLDDTCYHIRAVMSPSYTIVDDDMVFPPVLEALSQYDVETYRSFEYDEHATRLVIEFPNMSGIYQNLEYKAGLICSNSETGHSAIYIEPCAFAAGYHFVNRRILRKQGYTGRIIHRGEITSERITNMIEESKRIAQIGIVQLAEEWDKRITPTQAILFAKGLNMMPVRIFNMFQEEMQERQELAKHEVSVRLLQLAQELPLFQRVQIDQEVGEFMGIYRGFEARFQNIMNEIEG